MKKIIFCLMLSCMFSFYSNAQATMSQLTKDEQIKKRDEQDLVKREQTLERLKDIGANDEMIEKVMELLKTETELQVKLDNPELSEGDAAKIKQSFADESENKMVEILGNDLYVEYKNRMAKQESKPVIKKVAEAKKAPLKKKKS